MGDGSPFIIVGAGIAGLTAALALARNGIGVRVVERQPELTQIGAGIQLAPNAGRVLAALGLDSAIAAAAVQPAAMEVMDGWSGARLTSLDGARMAARYGFPYRVIHRRDLQTILADACQHAGVRIELGVTVAGLAPDEASVAVRIHKADRVESATAAALIAADGVWSAVRSAVAGSANAAPTGRTAWRATIGAPFPLSIPSDRVCLWLGPQAHLVHYPVARGAELNIVAIVEADWQAEGWSAAGDAEDIRARFGGWSAPARDLVAAAPLWQKFAIAAVDPTAAWRDNRIVLIGDAAHAMPPFLAQGAAMAIEDGAALADAVAVTGDTVAALSAYVAARRKRVIAVAAASLRAGRRFHMRGLMAIARNAALRVAGERLILSESDAIYRGAPMERGPLNA